MEQKNVDILTLTEYYMIMSNITQKPYMDKNFQCYLFEVKSDATAFAQGLNESSVKDAQYYRTLNLCSELYGNGFTGIKIKKRGSDKYIEIPVNKEDAKRYYYSHLSNRYINRLMQTKKKKYIADLKDAVFLAPLLVNIRMKGNYPSMYYSYAGFGSDTRYYVLFTQMSEFEEWNKAQTDNWKPVELDLRKFGRIRGDSPVIINPLSDKVILDNKQLSWVFKK